MKISLKDTFEKLPLPSTEKWPEGVFDIEAFRHGTMSVILFAPEGNDYQTPHDQDELYIVIKGAGILEVEGTEHPFEEGDSLFVKAGESHKFVKFTEGIQMWAIFWGEKGGESKKKIEPNVT